MNSCGMFTYHVHVFFFFKAKYQCRHVRGGWSGYLKQILKQLGMYAYMHVYKYVCMLILCTYISMYICMYVDVCGCMLATVCV